MSARIGLGANKAREHASCREQGDDGWTDDTVLQPTGMYSTVLYCRDASPGLQYTPCSYCNLLCKDCVTVTEGSAVWCWLANL